MHLTKYSYFIILSNLVLFSYSIPAYADSGSPFLTWLNNLEDYSSQIERHVESHPNDTMLLTYSNSTQINFGSFSNSTEIIFSSSNSTNPFFNVIDNISPLVFSENNGTNLSFTYSNGTNPYTFTYAAATNGIAIMPIQDNYTRGTDIVIKGTETPPTGIMNLFVTYQNTTKITYKGIEDLDGNFIFDFTPQQNWTLGTYNIILSSTMHDKTLTFTLH